LRTQTKKCLDLAAKGELSGRQVAKLSPTTTKAPQEQDLALPNAVNHLVSEKIKSLHGEEISVTSAISEPLDASAPPSLQDLKGRIEAYDTLSESLKGMQSQKIAQKLQSVLTEQKAQLQKQYEQMEQL